MITHTKNELVWVYIVSILILLWGTIPTWAGYQAETSHLRFRGLYFDSQDYAVHLATMEAGRHGEWTYQFRFTTEPHRPVYVRLFYIALGHFSRWFALSSDFTYHLARWLFGLFALLALYRLMRQIFPDLFWARTAFLLAAIGSGLGWLQLILNWTPGPFTPIDFWLIDDYIFFSLSIFPHFAFVTAGMCIAASLWLEFLERPHWQQVLFISLTAILVQFVNPIAFATVDISLVGATLFSWWRKGKTDTRELAALFVIAVAQLPLLAYNFLILNNDPQWSQFTAQNKTLSPAPVDYFFGFAPFWIPALIGCIVAFRTKQNALGAAIFWIVSGFLLAYAPVYIQRRFLQNVTLPLAILSTAGLIKLFEVVADWRPRIIRWRSSIVMLYVFLASISSLQIGLSQAAYLQTHPKDLYYPASLDHAIKWLRENAQFNDFVLASEQTSQVLAQNAGLRAYLGHEMETLYYENKIKEVDAFFQGELPQLASTPIKWVVYGPFERNIAPVFQAGERLNLVYEIEGLQIYQVK